MWASDCENSVRKVRTSGEYGNESNYSVMPTVSDGMKFSLWPRPGREESEEISRTAPN